MPEKGEGWKGLIFSESRNEWLTNQKAVESKNFKPTTYTIGGISLNGVWMKKPSDALIQSLGFRILSLGHPAREHGDRRSIFVLD